MRDRFARVRSRYAAWLEPSETGLPRARVLLAFPALLLVGGIILIALALNGTSSGVFYSQLHVGSDPDLILGQPEEIRSDEWNVQTVWAIAQVQQGLPERNETFPDGGMDTTVPQDLPRVDWSVAFRPHLFGFMIMPLDNAMAWKWWIPGLAVMGFAYAFFVSILPRRPLASAFLAVGFFFSPVLQWWYLNTTLWPVAWGFAVAAALVWAARDARRWTRWVWGAIAGYLTVVMAMGIYVPYILPVVLVVVFFAIGVLIQHWRRERGFGDAVGRYGPLLVGGTAGGAITGVWLATRLTVVEAFLSTDYPGERLTQSGLADTAFLVRTVGSAFSQTLKHGGLIGQNPSEASSFFLVGFFLLPAVVVAVVQVFRRTRRLPWMVIGVVASALLIGLFLFVPGWDAVAHLLFLDRSVPNRLRLGLGFASMLIVPLFVALLDARKRPSGWVVSAVVALLYIVTQFGVLWYLRRNSPGDVANAPWWLLFTVAGALVLFLIARRAVLVGSVLFALLCFVQSGTVNPVYRGVLDLRETSLSKAIRSIEASDPGTWVGIGGRLSTAVLLESGVEAFNGFQGAPNKKMWEAIDPDGGFEYQWNRLAGISWVPGKGEPVISNPYPDQIVGTFDGCSDFAKDNVKYVLSEDPTLSTGCLTLVKSVKLPAETVNLYRVGGGD